MNPKMQKTILRNLVACALRMHNLAISRNSYSTFTYKISRRLECFAPFMVTEWAKLLMSSCHSFSEENKIKLGKYNINYLKVGHGPHYVLCLPGAMGSIWTDFKHQIEGFDREKFSLIAWDAPGYGKSRPPEREFHANYFAQDIDIVFDFMKALKISKYSLMGWSYGGATSMIFAAKYPEIVQKLVIWGVCSFFLPKEIELYKKLKDTNTWSEEMRKPMIDLYGEEKLSKLWAQIIDAMASYGNNDGNVCSEFLSSIACPTFILYGEKDPLIDKGHVFHLQSNIKGSRIHLYPEGKHNIHIRHARDFNQRVQEFLLES